MKRLYKTPTVELTVLSQAEVLSASDTKDDFLLGEMPIFD